MTSDELKNEINKLGNITVIFEPNFFNENLIPKRELQNILEKSKVSLRGWDFPHISSNDKDDGKRPYFISGNGIEFYDCLSSFGVMEIFRFYQSGQFLAKFVLYEDTIGKVREKEIKTGEYIDFLSLIYRITEISIFIKNLVENTEIEGGNLIIELNNVKGRRMDSIFSTNIFPFFANYISGMNKIITNLKFSREEILNDSLSISRKLIGDIFTDFNWTNYSEQMIQTHQNNLINRKI
jgi:hypothetical protein